MGCLFVIVLGGLSAALVHFFGYTLWVMALLGLLWLTALVTSVLRGHHGFGGHGNTDVQIVIAGIFITAAIIIPDYSGQRPCNQPKMALRKLADAENKFFSEHRTFTTQLQSLNMTPNPDVYIMITRKNEQSFMALASHRLCATGDQGTPEVFVWDSARGGLQ